MQPIRTATGTVKLGVIASGRGSNLQAILDAIAAGTVNAEVTVVLSDNPLAFALERAKANGIPAVSCQPKSYPAKQAYEQAIVETLQAHGVELVVLAGYMRLVGPTILENFPNRMMNIHPALLPSFTGLHAQEQAWEYGVKFAGCTVHLVDAGMDTGPIILQAVVPVLDEDTAESLAKRILVEEHRIYSEAIRLYSKGCLALAGRRVYIRQEASIV